ncbi:DHS-like NAD/FAD-binding domain-containing protein [Artomyces pyxidatus]|uniref:DHS-like NAD/FAD-binding domain-containing protein n=1 Tax=Artomyces pyxidatus TaxID=48021 RepID=A0ACB8TIG9_9AGAM|nr:DHS-like NAD/FAD-binding domain-containing protein [Artomyces pyxidatus]
MVVTLDLEASTSDAATRRTLSSLSLSVAKSKRIVVVTGAGISCSSGIPDFRSSDGLYNLVKKQYPNAVLKGRDLFDASLFRDPTSTSLFYTFISQLKQSIDSAAPSPTHHFIKTLDSKKKLLRSYTQNIDGLEERAGLVGSSSQEVKTNGKGKSKINTKDVRNVQLHGDIHRVRCSYCSIDLPCSEEYLRFFNDGLPPDCPECTLRSEARLARSARPLKIGTLRPAIVLYDEAHPLGDDIGCIQAADVSRKPDMLIIMGTSLKVHGLRKLVKDFAKAVHASAPAIDPSSAKSQGKSWMGKVVFINKGAPGTEWNGIIDYHIEGETDVWAAKVLEDWRKLRPADWEIQQTLDDDGAFKAVKEGTGKANRKFMPPSLAPHITNADGLCRWQETICAWDGEYPADRRCGFCCPACEDPQLADEAPQIDLALCGWESIEETGSWDDG